jgi:hypothetical protein
MSPAIHENRAFRQSSSSSLPGVDEERFRGSAPGIEDHPCLEPGAAVDAPGVPSVDGEGLLAGGERVLLELFGRLDVPSAVRPAVSRPSR